MKEYGCSFMSYPGFFPQDAVPSDVNRSKCSAWSCLGFIISLIVIAIVFQLPGILDGTIIYVGGPWAFLMTWGLFLGPLIVLGLAIRWIVRQGDKPNVNDVEA